MPQDATPQGSIPTAAPAVPKVSKAPQALPRPEFPHTEAADRDKFFLVWSPYNQYLPATVYVTKQDADAAALAKAEANPGTDWYVLAADKFAYKARGAAVLKDTK